MCIRDSGCAEGVGPPVVRRAQLWRPAPWWRSQGVPGGVAPHGPCGRLAASRRAQARPGGQ
eukprot:9649752-Alexandrium_andersonii.AAC.1